MAEDKKEKKEKAKKEKDKKEAEDKLKEKNIDNIPNIIAAICPTYYASGKTIGAVEKLKKDGSFWAAVDKVKPAVSGRDSKGSDFFISYNSSMESLEPVYFWILDFLNSMNLTDIEKLVDNFVSSPGSGHFSELMGKATRMQEEAMKVMQTIGVLIKSIINIIYDLRQFEIRLKDYQAARSSDKSKAEAGLMVLKQIWMDNVDVKRQNTSIKGLAFSQASFATLIDAFMMAKSIKDIEKSPEEGGLDLNERVKNILKQRYLEFESWKELSEKELDKRYKMQKSWLKSQVDSLRLYSRWARPYFKAAEELRMGGSLSNSAALVKAFNTNLMQLTLLVKKPVDVTNSSLNKELPKGFDRLEEKGLVRKYYSCILLDFKFRGIPQRVDQHYSFGGKSDVSFKAYSLNQEEIDELKKRLEESDLKQALKLAEGATEESLEAIEDDIRYFLEDEDDREESDDKAPEKEEEKGEDINPFTALAGKGTFWGEKKKKESKSEAGKIKPDNYAEKVIRILAEFGARKSNFTVYDVYKKAHGMGSVPFGDYFEQGQVSVSFTDLFKK